MVKIIMKRYLLYINLETVELSQAQEDVESLPVVTVLDDGTRKYVSKGLEEVAEAIVGIIPFLGSEYSELVPVIVEVWDGSESNFSTARRLRIGQNRTES